MGNNHSLGAPTYHYMASDATVIDFIFRDFQELYWVTKKYRGKQIGATLTYIFPYKLEEHETRAQSRFCNNNTHKASP